MKSSYMDFEFGQLHYQHSVFGKKNTIIFLHSFNSSAASYAKVCDLLKDDFNIFALDLPGHGLSSHIDINLHAWYYSLEGFTDILIQFINRLQLKHFFIVGDSVGGNMGVRALPSLNELQGLILMCSVQSDSTDKLFAVHHDSAALKILFNKDLSIEETNIIASTYLSSLHTIGLEQMIYDVSHTDGNCRKMFSYYMSAQPWVNEPQILRNTTIPFMYILGQQDGFINYAAYKAHLIEEGIEESRIKIMDNVGHVPPLEDPELCANLISGFILK